MNSVVFVAVKTVTAITGLLRAFVKSDAFGVFLCWLGVWTAYIVALWLFPALDYLSAIRLDGLWFKTGFAAFVHLVLTILVVYTWTGLRTKL